MTARQSSRSIVTAMWWDLPCACGQENARDTSKAICSISHVSSSKASMAFWLFWIGSTSQQVKQSGKATIITIVHYWLLHHHLRSPWEKWLIFGVFDVVQQVGCFLCKDYMLMMSMDRLWWFGATSLSSICKVEWGEKIISCLMQRFSTSHQVSLLTNDGSYLTRLFNIVFIHLVVGYVMMIFGCIGDDGWSSISKWSMLQWKNEEWVYAMGCMTWVRAK